jgi:hypothetical protein
MRPYLLMTIAVLTAACALGWPKQAPTRLQWRTCRGGNS